MFTFGVFGIGQFIDLFLTSDMVDDWNRNPTVLLSQTIKQTQSLQQRILEICRNGDVTIGQICLGVSFVYLLT